jgi:hypothetical protein
MKSFITYLTEQEIFTSEKVSQESYAGAMRWLYDVVAVVDLTTADHNKRYGVNIKKADIKRNGDVLTAKYSIPYSDVWRVPGKIRKTMRPEYALFLDAVDDRDESADVEMVFNFKTRKLDIAYNNNGKIYVGLSLITRHGIEPKTAQKMLLKNKISTTVKEEYFLRDSSPKNMKLNGYINSINLPKFKNLGLNKEKTSSLITKFKLYDIVYEENFGMGYADYKKAYNSFKKNEEKRMLTNSSLIDIFKPPYFNKEERRYSGKKILALINHNISTLKAKDTTGLNIENANEAKNGYGITTTGSICVANYLLKTVNVKDKDWDSYTPDELIRLGMTQADLKKTVKRYFGVEVIFTESDDKIIVQYGWLSDPDSWDFTQGGEETFSYDESSIKKLNSTISQKMKETPSV